jgi:hypothetical protein
VASDGQKASGPDAGLMAEALGGLNTTAVGGKSRQGPA